MAYNIIYQDVNIVFTNMTSGVPQQIGCEPQPRFEIMQEGTSPMLTCRDCKYRAALSVSCLKVCLPVYSRF